MAPPHVRVVLLNLGRKKQAAFFAALSPLLIMVMILALWFANVQWQYSSVGFVLFNFIMGLVYRAACTEGYRERIERNRFEGTTAFSGGPARVISGMLCGAAAGVISGAFFGIFYIRFMDIMLAEVIPPEIRSFNMWYMETSMFLLFVIAGFAVGGVTGRFVKEDSSWIVMKAIFSFALTYFALALFQVVFLYYPFYKIAFSIGDGRLFTNLIIGKIFVFISNNAFLFAGTFIIFSSRSIIEFVCKTSLTGYLAMAIALNALLCLGNASNGMFVLGEIARERGRTETALLPL